MSRGVPLLWPLLLLLSGCLSGFNSNQPALQSYVLSLRPVAGGTAASGTEAAQPQPAAASGSASNASTLEVLEPVAGAGLNGEGIAVLRPGARLDYFTGARWAVPAPALLQTLVIQSLRRGGRFALVESDSGPFDANYLLSLELTHFEADYGGAALPTVRVALVCALGQRTGRHLLASFTAEANATAEADRMQAVVAAFEQATNQVLRQLTRQLQVPETAAALKSTP